MNLCASKLSSTCSERKQELAEQLLYKAKQIETLIAVLPSASDLKLDSANADKTSQGGEASEKDEADLQAEDHDKELQELEAEMQVVNADYMQILTTAGKSYVLELAFVLTLITLPNFRRGLAWSIATDDSDYAG